MKPARGASGLAGFSRVAQKPPVRSQQNRVPLACVLLGGALLIGTLLATLGWDRTWRVWNVQVAVQRFLDSQVIAAGAASYRDGYDPLRFNPHDIGHRPMNYPRVWQRLFDLGFRQEHAEVFGWTLAAMLVIGVWLALPSMGWGEAAVVGAVVFSPAVLLGVERGNTDLAVFFVLALALAVPRAAWHATWIAVAFALKLFPLAAAAVLLGRERRAAMIGAGALAVFAVAYLVTNFTDLRLISAGTPRDTWLSYGLNVVPLRVGQLWPGSGLVAGGLAWAITSYVVFASVRARLLETVPVAEPASPDAALDAFRVGAACYVGTFLLGNNFIYRLVFLVFTVPQLWRWVRLEPGRRTMALAALAAVFVSVWVLGFDRSSWVVRRDEWAWFSVGQVANWTLFVAFCRLLASDLPDWAVAPLRRLTRRT